ncbi:Mov34/MPN/PAD-1 family protein [Ignisphaera sp. 4213-co]|uniref:Mov34/MPN/PAD-1 family protein n=1 Tax=Ignisphaera cupida TaxID=3050454 RepID=A0ABD4Z5R2_9CREN|nr:Mov34/MPN/PAD-1 family protein [Ignisphaera sp. 4213-co]MDK6028307.1 Mov34/MPN/PAD-1 family protein [Ignisphaera sp. 4213-co]
MNSHIERIFFGIGKIEVSAYRIVDIIECKNIAKNPETEFLADPMCMYNVYKQAEGKGLEIIALIHSHPADPVPSNLDLKNMRLWEVPWIIINNVKGSYKAWTYNKEKGLEEIEIVEEDYFN